MKNQCPMQLTVQFDGGCLGNPGSKYGSYQITGPGVWMGRNRFDLGHGTNNEAEFEALIRALDHLLEPLGGPIEPRDTDLILQTDSTIVRNRLIGKNKTCKDEPQQRMFKLNAECLRLLGRFRSFKVEWVSRDKNVETFGH